MSLTTNFNFAAYAGDLRSRKLNTHKTGLSLILLNSDDIKRLAVVEVNVPCGGERRDAPWLPRVTHSRRGHNQNNNNTKDGDDDGDENNDETNNNNNSVSKKRLSEMQQQHQQDDTPHTFFDLKMGNFSAPFFRTQTCATCCAGRTQKKNASVELENERCQGHFGYISMPRRYPLLSPQLIQHFTSASYGNLDDNNSNHNNVVTMFNPAERLFIMNPHLLKEIEAIVRSSCFFCHRFRTTEFDMERYIQALKLVDLGYVAEALELLQKIPPSRKIFSGPSAAAKRQRKEAAEADAERNKDEHAKKNHQEEVEVEGEEDATHLERFVNEEKVNDMATLLEYTRHILASRPPSALLRNKSNTSHGYNNNNNNNKSGSSSVGQHRRGAPPPFENLDLYSLDVRNDICKQALTELRQLPFLCPHCSAVSPRFTTKNEQLYFYFQKKKLDINVGLGVLSREQIATWDEENTLHRRSHSYFPPTAAREQIKQLCQHEKEAELLHKLFPHLGESAVEMPVPILLQKNLLYKVFFLDKILVPPLAVRLSSGVMVTNGQLIPDDLTRNLSEVLQFVKNIESYMILLNQAAVYGATGGGRGGGGDEDDDDDDESEEDDKNKKKQNNKKSSSGSSRKSEKEKQKKSVIAQILTPKNKIAYEQNLQSLQSKVNEIYSATLETFAKKEGLFRTNMMGKRVNQACRSVISPDYLVEPNEVLLPRPFAKSLSFPEQVQPRFAERTQFLQQCALNGPHVYPGASHLEIHTVNSSVRFLNLRLPLESRRRQVMQLFALAANPAGGTTLVLHRHVLSGDRLIFNRQPTLHKVSMMGYKAKVLSGLKTLRFHYVNGKSYNADFDGDEMNVHIPQSLAAAAELDVLMDADSQYILPTSGKPIRGLIQDHIAAGVLLTLRDKFYTRDHFVQLLYRSVEPYLAKLPGDHDGTLTEQVPVPAILLPRPLWTGKQLVSAIVRFLSAQAQNHNWLQHKKTVIKTLENSKDEPLPSFTAQGVTLQRVSLIQPNVYTTTEFPKHNHNHNKKKQDEQEEEVEPPLHVAKPGAMDDHMVRVLKGELITGVLCKNQLGPSNLSLPHVLHEIYGPRVVGDLFGALGRALTHSLQQEGFSMGMDDMLLRLQGRRVRLLRELDNTPLTMDTTEEGIVLPAIMRLATQLQNEFVPGRMLLPFPKNQLLMMTMSGAKGSNTNAIQMSVCLGQQLFDGHRVRPMKSGKTLPCFFASEQRARSFGFAMGSFSTGIRPGEYTIHAMAGRDGLIDTAIKTARSGHLQRCLIKGMENLVLQWDQSVRDSNGSVIQFCYGGDGLDPIKCSTLLEMALMEDNFVELCKRFQVKTGMENGEDEEEGGEGAAEGKRPRAGSDQDDDEENNENEDNNGRVHKQQQQQRTVTQKEILNQHLEPLPPLAQQRLEQFLAKKSQFPLFRKIAQVERWERQIAKKKKQQQGADATITMADKLKEKKEQADAYLQPLLSELLQTRRLWARSQPGEPVGLLAAQAAGEPSTQMTLNTFHSAGSTVTHVTEGIPRLRELLIYASVNKSAVVVPVKKATAADEAALHAIVTAGVDVKLMDCLACPPIRKTNNNNHNNTNTSAVLPEREKGYHFVVESLPAAALDIHHHRRRRGHNNIMINNNHHAAGGGCKRVTITLLFSHLLLEAAQHNMCMSKKEHTESFLKSLVALAKFIAKEYHGRNSRAAAAGAAGGGEEEEVAAAAAGTDDNNDNDNDNNNNEDDDDDNNEHENDSEDSASDDDDSNHNNDSDSDDNDEDNESAEKKRKRKSSGHYRHEHLNDYVDDPTLLDMADEMEEDSDNSDDDEQARKNKKKSKRKKAAAAAKKHSKTGKRSREDDEDEDEHEEAEATAAAASYNDHTNKKKKASYHKFSPIKLSLHNDTYQVEIAPYEPFNNNHHKTNNYKKHFFMVNIRIHMQEDNLLVLSDTIDRALRRTALPSWLPRFQSIHFTRSASDSSSGELIFQGSAKDTKTNIRDVVNYLSYFTTYTCEHNYHNNHNNKKKNDKSGILLHEATSTDIQDVCQHFGIEGGYASLLTELNHLFKRYAVDERHLSLIADTATHRGRWENFNFTGVISRSASPLFQMTFASAKRFIHEAVSRGLADTLQSVSAAVMVGAAPQVGTACAAAQLQPELLGDVVERWF